MDAEQAKKCYEQAVDLYNRGEFAGALALLDRLHEAYPQNNTIAHARARVLNKLGEQVPKAACPSPMPAAAASRSSRHRAFWAGAVAGIAAIVVCCALFLWPGQSTTPGPVPSAPPAPVAPPPAEAPLPQAAPAAPAPAADTPKPAVIAGAFPAECKLGAPIVTATGRWIFRASEPAKLLLSDDAGESWRTIEKPPCATTDMWCHNVYVCPNDDSRMMVGLGGNGDLLVTEDDGATWRMLLPCYTPIGNEKKQIMTAFWKLSDKRTVLALPYEQGLLEVVVASGAYSPLAAAGFLKEGFHRYECAEGKHYLHLWGVKETLFTAIESSDDGKTWQEVLMEDTPWRIEGKIHSQLAALSLGDDEKGRVLDSYDNVSTVGEIVVEWATSFGSDKRIYAQVSPTQGKLRENNTGIFFSDDDGANWSRINPDESQEGLPQLFLAEQFLSSSEDGSKKLIRIRNLSYDSNRDVIFAAAGGVCYRSSSKAEPWAAMNEAAP